jgi:hypothetical protein
MGNRPSFEPSSENHFPQVCPKHYTDTSIVVSICLSVRAGLPYLINFTTQTRPSAHDVCILWSDDEIRAIPESPRHLVSKDRYDEARAILVKYHAEGDENSKLCW